MKQITNINDQFPHLPNDYISWVKVNGAVESSAGFMVYSAPIPSNEILDGLDCEEDILLVADDMAGYFIGFQNTLSEWVLVGIDSCILEVEKLYSSFTSEIES